MANVEYSDFATQVLSVMFSNQTANKLRHLMNRIHRQEVFVYITCSLIFVATAAHHPDLLTLKRRLETFPEGRRISPKSPNESENNKESRDKDNGSAERWADAGFFVKTEATAAAAAAATSSSLICFHCGLRCEPSLLFDSTADPLKQHLDGSPNCQLARLLKAAEVGAVPADAAKLHRACVKLHNELGSASNQHLLGCVASYGFDKRRMIFVICRQFMRSRDGALPTSRPGDLIQLMQDSEPMLDSMPDETVVDIQRALTEACQTREVLSSSATPAQLQPQQSQAMAQQLQQPSSSAEIDKKSPQTDDSDQCVTCKSSRRSHVTLPCAHFLLCGGCLSRRSNCPECGEGILASIRAYIA